MNPLKKIKLAILKRCKFLPPEIYIPIYHQYYTGQKLDLQNPESLGEKIQWLKVFYRNKSLPHLVDKYLVRNYVKEKVGEKFLNKLFAIHKKPKDVDFNSLPNQFIIKATHGYHFNLIVRDKIKLNKVKAKWLMKKWMGRNHYYRCGMEWAYKDLKPKIIIEKYLEEPGKEVIYDYKFFCFHGKPKFIQVDIERGIKNYRSFYNLEWQKLPFSTKTRVHFKDEVEKPNNLKEMIWVATKLANSLPFVRVDLYSVEDQTVFGEMTFYPSSGKIRFVPEKYNKIIGDYLKLPKSS